MEPFFSTTNDFNNSDAVFSLGDANFPWEFSTLEGNIEAQKLLEAAMAHNDQYRADDDQKRKLEMLEDIVQQAPSKASHNLNITSVPHPELVAEADDTQSTSEKIQSEQLNEPQKKKPGRKPLTNTPNNKRKAQNRAAQRAFRERKERYVKELETKIEELESLTAKSAQENQQLKTLVEQLQAENFILKQTSFTFEFPLEKAGDSTVSIDKDITELVSIKPILHPASVANVLDPYTPPSSNVSDDELSSPKSISVGKSDHTPDVTGSSSKSSPHAPELVFGLNTLDLHIPPAVSTTSAHSHSTKPQSAKEFCDKFADGICQNHQRNSTLETPVSSNGTADSSKSSAAFTEYRDPTSFTSNIDNPFSESDPLPPLFEENFKNFGSFAPMATPLDERKNPLGGNFHPVIGFASQDDVRNKKFLSCNKVWERIQQHPRFDDLEGDEIDQLCTELKSKAKCSGHGPVVPEDELEAVLVKLEDK